jgi:transcriptional regulator
LDKRTDADTRQDSVDRSPESAAPRRASPFERFADADVIDLIADYPLAWLLPAGDGSAALPSLLPLLPDIDSEGHLVGLIGHMATRNSLVAALRTNPAALVLFTGPQSYIPPTLVSDPRWAPTWNYAQLRIEGEVTFDPKGGDAAIAALVDAMNRRHGGDWSAALMGERYRPMERAIIAFYVRITRIEGRYKLGQDEAVERLREIVDGLDDAAMTDWMRRFNSTRL